MRIYTGLQHRRKRLFLNAVGSLIVPESKQMELKLLETMYFLYAKMLKEILLIQALQLHAVKSN